MPRELVSRNKPASLDRSEVQWASGRVWPLEEEVLDQSKDYDGAKHDYGTWVWNFAKCDTGSCQSNYSTVKQREKF